MELETEVTMPSHSMNSIDAHLLEQIRSGNRETWNDLVVCFQGRLIAFAERQVAQTAIAEDLVQETFVSFLKAVDRFREECDIETFLFQILRRRIVDHYRTHGRNLEIQVCECMDDRAVTVDDPALAVARIDAAAREQKMLSEAIRLVCERMQQRKKFRDLKIAEGTLFAALSNAQVATLLECQARKVATVKHRIIERLSAVLQDLNVDGTVELTRQPSEGLLQAAWENQRPSCLKRTTLGKFHLGLLDENWNSYAFFHTQQLGCRFCVANLQELSSSNVSESDADFSRRVFQSTIGFL